MENVVKKTKGRQKVPLARMEKESNRLVTFSKRRSGLFKKASELCTLCGVETGIVVFSPGNKAYSFGHPSVDAIIHRFLNADFYSNSNSFHGQTSNPRQNEAVLMSNLQLSLIHDHLDWEKKQFEGHTRNRKVNKEDFRWLSESQKLTGENLDTFKELLGPFTDAVRHLYHNNVAEVNDTNDSVFTGSNVSRPTYQFSSVGMPGGENHVSTLYGGQPHQVAPMVPSDLVGGPSNFDQSQMVMMMNQTPMGEGFGDPSLPRGSSNMAIDHILNGNVNANASTNVNVNPISSLQNPMGFGFSNPTLMPSFQGENNPMGSQFRELPPPLPSMNMVMNPNPMPPGPPMNFGMSSMPIDFQNFASSSSSSQAGVNSMDIPSAPYNLSNEFGFGNGGIY